MAESDHFHVLPQSDQVRVIELDLPVMIDGEDFDILNRDLLTTVGDAGAVRWVIDLSRVSYLGSAMLGLMVNVRQRIKQSDGALVLCGLNERLMDIFETSSLVRLFRIVRSRGEAIRVAERAL